MTLFVVIRTSIRRALCAENLTRIGPKTTEIFLSLIHISEPTRPLYIADAVVGLKRACCGAGRRSAVGEGAGVGGRAGGQFFQAEDGIRDVERSRGLGDVYKRQEYLSCLWTDSCQIFST